MINNGIIGLTGLAQSGKSTVANFLVTQRNYRRMRLAQGLKDMARCIGLTENQVDGDAKEIPLELLCGKTPRYFLQMLGTEFGRNLIGSELWKNITEQRIKDYLLENPNNKVVVDDIRFINELDMIKNLGGVVIRIVRIGQVSTSTHPSETALNNIELPTIIAESGDMNKLYKGLDEIIGGR